MKKIEIERKLINVEIKLGFLYLPKMGVQHFPSDSSKIDIDLDGAPKRLTYNADHRRIFGLTAWFKKHKAKPKDQVTIHVSAAGKYALRFSTKSGTETDESNKEAEKLLDISGISSQAKGDIVEDRVKELLILHGQGLLNVFKPVTDTQGIDLVVTTTGQFHPIFLQVKSRYTLQNKSSIVLAVNAKTFKPHPSFFVIGAYFNPGRLEIHEDVLLIPSADFANEGAQVKSYNRYQIVAPLNPKSKSKWAKYLVPKTELANRLIERFEEMNQYYK